jgi:tRNA 5-methylaminomethyl-2-thiouridine biosynthesis bifunctional protein
MPEPIDWRDDGTLEGSPFSPRFQDRYRSEQGGIDQAREVFLNGCGLPGLWTGQPHWCILENGFGLGLNFLVAWQAWQASPERPRLLHFVSTEAWPASASDLLRAAAAQPELLPLARQLAAQFWGLLPGVHRLVFETGRVLLTLLIGDAKTMLRKQNLQADSLYLDGFSPDRNPDMWDLQACKALARCCRRGTRLGTWTVARSVREALAQSGFVVQKAPGAAPKRDRLQGEFNPAWRLRQDSQAEPVRRPARCVVVGAGLAGAAVAASLARRGWSVVVLDAAPTAASGASSLPAGVLAPHVSPDDSVLSRLSRRGVRATLQQLETHLRAGLDWQMTGVLERSLGDSPRRPPAEWLCGAPGMAEAAQRWVQPASAAQLAQCGLADDTPALWHASAAWVKPAALVQAWLATPGVQFEGNAQVTRIVREGGIAGEKTCASQDETWQVLDRADRVLATAELVILAAGMGSVALACSAESLGFVAPSRLEAAPPKADSSRSVASAAIDSMTSLPLTRSPSLALQAVRGQVLWGWHEQADHGSPAPHPPFPVNGLGSLIANVPMDGQPGSTDKLPKLAWLFSGTYQRASADCTPRREDDETNKTQLRSLLPELAEKLLLDACGKSATTQPWVGIRCTTPNRLPALGPLKTGADSDPVIGLWLCTGMGSRGLSFAALCAEVLAACLHAEPMPVEDRLVKALLPRHMKI